MIAALLHTDGNGELLEKVFSSLSHILYGNDSGVKGTFHLLIKLALTVGAFSALCLAFLRQKFEPLIRSFFLPGLTIIALIFTPRTNLEIRDHFNESVRKVENVSWFLGNMAAWSSELFYRVKTLFAEAAKTQYPWTKQIYAGKSPFISNPLTLSDTHFETHFREFCRECVFRDLGLGLYTREELSKSADLFAFLKEKTSRKRTVFYQGGWIPCREAIEKIDAILTNDLLVDALIDDKVFAKEQAIRQLLKSDAPDKEWIKQQIAIHLLKEEIRSGMIPLKKEETRSYSALAASAAISLRNFFEALLYLTFPLILLLSLLSFGFKLILHWMRLLLWISLWPILYVAVDLFIQALWEFRLGQATLTLGNMRTFADLYSSMEIIAAFAIACIPLFTWILLQGGISQMVNLSSAPSVIASPAKGEAGSSHVKAEVSLPVQESTIKQSFNGGGGQMKSENTTHIRASEATSQQQPLKETVTLSEKRSETTSSAPKSSKYSNSTALQSRTPLPFAEKREHEIKLSEKARAIQEKEVEKMHAPSRGNP